MDAVGKAARRLALDAALEADGRTQEAETREYLREIVDVVLDAVGYAALRAELDELRERLTTLTDPESVIHQSSDEGTCWCSVAEQAGRERDRLRDLLRQLSWVSGASEHPAKADGECGFCGLDPCPYGQAQLELGADDDDDWVP